MLTGGKAAKKPREATPRRPVGMSQAGWLMYGFHDDDTHHYTWGGSLGSPLTADTFTGPFRSIVECDTPYCHRHRFPGSLPQLPSVKEVVTQKHDTLILIQKHMEQQ